MYKHKDCFFIYSSFLAGKEAKEAGGTYDGSPLTPFQRSTGESKDGKARKKIPGAESMIQCKSPGRTGQRAQPAPSIAPAQGDRVRVSHQAVVRTAPRERKAKEGEKRRDYPGQGNSRMQKLWPEEGAATSRPPPRCGRCWLTGFAFLGRWQGLDGGERRCREGVPFLGRVL